MDTTSVDKAVERDNTCDEGRAEAHDANADPMKSDTQPTTSFETCGP
jgi:hypothetical protein